MQPSSNSSRLSSPFARCSLIVAAALLLCAAITIAIVQSFIEQQRQTYGHDYGQALANVAAYQSQEATLEHDLLSLQIILGDIAKNPAVIGATIHDVENRLLVQGGHNPDIRRQYQADQLLGSYTAPITLHDSIAGYVTVSLALPAGTDASLYIKLLVLPMAILCLALSLLRRSVFNGAGNSALPILAKAADSGAEENDSATTEPSADAYIDEQMNEIYRVQLQLHIGQLNRLKQQINASSYKKLLAQFERQVRGVCSLYNGELVHANGVDLVLLFSAESQTDATFNALCSAKLLQSLSLQGNFDLAIKAHIHSAELTLQQQLKLPLPQLILSVDEALLSDKLLRRAQFDNNELVSLENPWSELITKQLRQLQRLSES